MPDRPLVEAINDLLPQTQCRRCGFEGCRPYAQALADGQTELNRCPPGGQAGIARLAALLNRPSLPLDPTCGEEGPIRLARIDEDRCIGCALCLAACPVDAIVGSFKQMHTVILEDCTGCGLCLPPCPVDCIDLTRPRPDRSWTADDALRSKAAHARHLARRQTPEKGLEEAKRQRLLQAALSRAKSRPRQATPPTGAGQSG